MALELTSKPFKIATGNTTAQALKLPADLQSKIRNQRSFEFLILVQTGSFQFNQTNGDMTDQPVHTAGESSEKVYITANGNENLLFFKPGSNSSVAYVMW